MQYSNRDFFNFDSNSKFVVMATVNSNSSAKMATLDVDDLLSEDSNDSFFEDPKILAKRGSLTKTPPADKKSVANIFGFTDEKDQQPKKVEDDWLGLGDIGKKPTKKVSEDEKILSSLEIKKTEGKAQKSNFEEDEDILSSLGFGKKINVETEKASTISTTKKVGLFDDILGVSPKKEKKKVDFSDILGESKQKTPEQKETISVPTVRRSRSSATSGLSDPLGLFTTQEKPDEAGDAGRKPSETIPQLKPKPTQTKSTPNISTELPDWLSGVKQNKSEADIPKQEEQHENLATPVLDELIAQQKLATVNVSFQNTAMAMQQQETQLMVAMQLKKYEEKLVELQKQQQDILVKQDRQFNDLLQKQFLKQQILEDNMRQQQQRIQSHIEVLMGSSAGGDDLKKFKEDVNPYEEIIATLKQRQNEEIFLLEESYKKQISFLEQGIQSLENRLKIELETAIETYQNKMTEADERNKNEISKYQQKLQEMWEQQAHEIKMLRENHLRVVEEIKNEYTLLTDNLKQTKTTEGDLLANAGEYTQKLERSLSVLDSNSKTLSNIQSVIEKSSGTFYATREESIRAKEEEIKLMKQTLEKARESAETERSQLMSLVRTLEMKIVEQNQNAREERWALQQATATLTAKAAALDREADFNRSLLEREREQIKTLKESILAEQERSLLYITEQRLALEAEKSRLETATKLNKNHDPQVARAEIDAAVQMAKEAAELTDREREKLQRQQYELESLKRNLLDKERKLMLKEKELDLLMQKAETKIRDSDKAMDNAKLLEIKCNERTKDLQNQMVSLTSRERKLAEEKIELSRERLALHTTMRQNRKCGLCAADSSSKNEENFVFGENSVEPDFHNLNVVESDFQRFRLEIDENNEDFAENHKDY